MITFFEKIWRLWKMVANMESEKIKSDRYENRQQAMLRPVHDMAAFITANYEFRHNVVRDVYEYRRKGEEEDWQMVDGRQLNTINCQVQDDGEIFCLSSFVKQRVESNLAVDYHPIRAYMDKVRGRWDGKTDYVGELARRINGSPYCEKMVRKWLRAVVMQWTGRDHEHANAVMLLLVSSRQGLHKSTFLRSLMPPEISDYYTDDFSLTAKGYAYRKMVEFGLVNIDEFDKIPHKKMPELKSMMQTMKPSFIGAYKKNFNLLPRIASFVGTSNERHLLTDRTGSRRFLILEPSDIIPVEGINHEQLYAQLLDEVERQHLPHYFSKEDEAEIERRNRRYYVVNEVERLFLAHFSIPKAKGDGIYMDGNELIRKLTKHSRKTMEGVTPNQFGRYMTRLNVLRVKKHDRDVYLVNEK
ncbi:MAG: DUF3874 domain-containing protein [Prevotella sp.]|nr:DUF3874 domain-containing protein [Prevotella sp.]